MDFVSWLVMVFTFIGIGEGLNCSYPAHDGEYENSGMICQWEHDSFYYEPDSCKWVLKEEYEGDNWVEAKVRSRYWGKN